LLENDIKSLDLDIDIDIDILKTHYKNEGNFEKILLEIKKLKNI
jgi:hypothetical protein